MLMLQICKKININTKLDDESDMKSKICIFYVNYIFVHNLK